MAITVHQRHASTEPARPLEALARGGRIVFGCGRLHHVLRRRERERLIRTALECGIREFDVAPAYGNGLAERVLGELLPSGIEGVCVNTKAGIPLSVYPALPAPAFPLARAFDIALGCSRRAYSRRDFRPAALNASLDASLRRLRIEAVGTFLLHEPVAPFPSDTWHELRRAMEQLVAAGKARAWGVAGPLWRYWNTDTSGTRVPVLQFPAEELDDGVSAELASRRITYSTFTAYRLSKSKESFVSYLSRLSEQHPDASFIIATRDPERMAAWFGRPS